MDDGAADASSAAWETDKEYRAKPSQNCPVKAPKPTGTSTGQGPEIGGKAAS